MLNRTYGDKLAVIANQKTAEREYWLHQLSGTPEKSNFPFDFTKENIIESRMETVKFRFHGELFSKLMKLCNHSDVKLNMILLAGLETLLSKYTDSNDIMIGTPIYQQQTDGDFINTILVLRNRLEGSMTFKQLLLQVRKTINEATENQNYPIELLVEPLNMPVLGNEFPYFDTIILLHNIHYKKYIHGIYYHMLFAFNRTDQYIEAELEYNASLYRERTVQQIVNHYTRLMEKVLLDMNMELSCVDILSGQEKHQILVEFNANAMDFPKEKTFNQLFEEQVERTGDNIAVIGMGHGALGMASITYNQLNEKSNQLAWILREKGVQPDNVVGLMVDRSIEMIIGILAILKSGGAYLPIDPDYPEERIRYMLADSSAKILLPSIDNLPVGAGKQGGLAPLYLPIEDCPKTYPKKQPATRIPQLATSFENLAYVIYTSGSTGKPKGVLVEHRNVVANLSAFLKEFKITPQDTMIQLSSYTFDAFIEEVFPLLVSGGKIAIPPGRDIMDMEEMALFIQQHQVTIIDCTPLLLNAFNKLNPSYLASVRFFISGGDVLKLEYVDQLAKQGTLYNTYGPTEATVCASYYKCPENCQSNVPIGKPISNYCIYILGNSSRLLPIGVAGELCISGAGVSRGYLNNPELTADKFREIQDNIPVGTGKQGGFAPLLERLYHSGDLARWLPDGNVEFLGRMDDQVKVRGFRIELGEIESKLLEHKHIKNAVVVQKTEATGDRYLCGYIISDQSLEAPVLRDYLADKLPDYMIPWFFIQLEQLPLTPNGKIDRKALPEPESRGAAEYIPPRDEMEKELVKIWADVFSIENEKIGIDTGFFDLGGNSLKVIILVSKIHKTFNVKVNLVDIFRLQTIRCLSEWIKGSQKTTFIDINPLEKREYYELSYSQKRLWIIHQVNPSDTSYNIPGFITLEHDVDVEIVRKSLAAIMMRYESFRTAFKEKEGEPIQLIEETVEIPLEIIDISSLGEKARQRRRDSILREETQTPFDLTRPPLFRTRLVKCQEDCWDFVFNMHHIISDGWSHEILKRDFTRYYEALQTGGERKFEPLRVQYKDFAVWNNRQLENPLVKEKSHRFWLQKLESGLSGFFFPYDFSGYEDDSTSASYRTMVDKKIKERLKKIATDNNTTLFFVMFSAYNWLLSRYSSQKDIVCSIISAGREHEALQGIVGFFINSLASKIRVDSEEKFDDFLPRVDREIMELFQHQGYPPELVLDDLKMPFPEIDVSFNMLNMQQESAAAELELLDSYHVENMWNVKFGLALHTIEYKNAIEINWIYKKALFNPTTIKLISGGYLELLNVITGHPEKKEEK